MSIIQEPSLSSESGFTLIEMMIVTTIIGVLASIAIASYQTYIRKTQMMTIYQEINHFRMPYQISVNEGEGVRSFDPEGLNMPLQTQYCQFSVTAPNKDLATSNAIKCQIQDISYLDNQTLALDRAANGTWQCRASSGIPTAYLPVACR